MLFISLLSFAVLLDSPNPPIGRTEPVHPSFEFHAPPPLSAWERIQPALDRSSGRIVDDATYELDRAALLRSPYDPASDLRIFHMDRDRWLRLNARELDQQRLATRSASAQREAKMQLKEYELFLNDTSDPYSAVAAQAEADRLSLERAKNVRDEQLKAAGIDSAKSRLIHETYQRERTRILGFDLPPSTQPTTSPTPER